MARYFFSIKNGMPHMDDVGEDLRDDHEAWRSAKRLARNIEDSWSRTGLGPLK
jgi:hypothetical protein